ncbi:MAG: hypothetical protein KDA52_07990 [Planctomycetaceae bacterium]|nr:hypothetical protein [Planctomycetaceae bacterium]
MPTEFSRDGYHVDPGTIRLYNHLIDHQVVATVDEIDEWQIPWIYYDWPQQDGKIEYHSLAINDDSWVYE